MCINVFMHPSYTVMSNIKQANALKYRNIPPAFQVNFTRLSLETFNFHLKMTNISFTWAQEVVLFCLVQFTKKANERVVGRDPLGQTHEGCGEG